MSAVNILISGSMISSGFANSLNNAFKSIGWIVYEFDDISILNEQGILATNKYSYRLFWRQLAGGIQKCLISKVVKLKPDILLIIKGFYFSPETIAEIKRLSPFTKLMHFNPDNSFNTWHFGNSNDWVINSIPLFDVHLTWGQFLIPKLQAAGAKSVFYLPFACDSDLHQTWGGLSKTEAIEYGSDVAFVGSWDEEREWWLSHLLDYRLKIWGNSWNKADKRIQEKWQRKAVYGSDFSKVCAATKINLNIIRKQNIPAHNMRTFEIPACGGFMLSTRTSEQNAIWAEGEEIACFSSPEELRQMVDQYVEDEQARTVMGLRANKKACLYYSYTERARQIETIYRNFDLTLTRKT